MHSTLCGNGQGLQTIKKLKNRTSFDAMEIEKFCTGVEAAAGQGSAYTGYKIINTAPIKMTERRSAMQKR